MPVNGSQSPALQFVQDVPYRCLDILKIKFVPLSSIPNSQTCAPEACSIIGQIDQLPLTPRTDLGMETKSYSCVLFGKFNTLVGETIPEIINVPLFAT